MAGNIGFIGFGSMGKMLVKGLIESGQAKQEQIIVTRKEKNRLDEIRNAWPEIGIAREISDIVKKAELIFICVKPLDYKNVLDEMKPFIRTCHHIISIAGTVGIEHIEKALGCKITKLMPTIVSEVKEGILLICHNGQVTGDDARQVELLLGCLGKIRRVDEKDFGFASELTSCGPGLIAAVFRELARSGLRHASCFTEEDMAEMILQTLYGTSRLMIEKKMDFGDVISRVATKGGITEEGVRVLEKGLPPVFDEMLEMTMKKREAIGEKVSGQFKDA